MPFKYWERGKLSYLISIVNDKDIREISPSIITVINTQKIGTIKKTRPQTNEEKPEQSQNESMADDHKYDKNTVSVSELKNLHMKSLTSGKIKEAQRYFKKIKEKNEN